LILEDDPGNSVLDVFKVIKCSITTITQDPMGAVSGGRLIVTAPLGRLLLGAKSLHAKLEYVLQFTQTQEYNADRPLSHSSQDN
jgi:hypothetical protein